MPSFHDPDRSMVRSLWVLWGVMLVLVVPLVLWLGQALNPLLPLLAPVLALLVFWPLWRIGRATIRALLNAPHTPWQGQYFEFDGRQIRVLFDDEDRVWTCARDVFDALGTRTGARIPQRVRLLVGRDGLADAPGTRLLCFTERGLAVWLERRTGRQAAAFQRWWLNEVLNPYRKRQEIESG
jgi:hypothetical protein